MPVLASVEVKVKPRLLERFLHNATELRIALEDTGWKLLTEKVVTMSPDATVRYVWRLEDPKDFEAGLLAIDSNSQTARTFEIVSNFVYSINIYFYDAAPAKDEVFAAGPYRSVNSRVSYGANGITLN